MEKTSPYSLSPSFLLASVVGSFLFHGILNWVFNRIQMFYLGFPCFLQSQFDQTLDKLECRSEKKFLNSEFSSQNVCINQKVDDEKLSKEDLQTVMGKLRIDCNPNDEKLEERLGLDQFMLMFEEKGPSADEMKLAFDVFDKNRDGFVDATELQRVLCSLGFREGSEEIDCESMIRTFDENGDGRIDFNEFVKLMERSFF